jgi:hypothetical protein
VPGVPDPVSVLWEPAAAKFYAGVRAAGPGRWFGIRIADPEPRHVRLFEFYGIELLERDRASTGSLDARDRWRRGFVRAVYRQAKGGPPLVLEVGRKMPRRGRIPPGRFVRGRILRGKEATARRKEQRVTGNPAARADPRSRDW